MMKWATTLLIVSFAVLASAQDKPKGEIFGGYQFLSIDGKGDPRFNPHGWDADVAGHLSPNLAIVGDVGGVYKNGTHTYTFMGGPRLTAGSGKISPFVEALVGAANSGDSNGSSTDFAFAFGGGVDIQAKKRIAIRIIRFDYLGVRSRGELLNNFRFTPGIVFKF